MTPWRAPQLAPHACCLQVQEVEDKRHTDEYDEANEEDLISEREPVAPLIGRVSSAVQALPLAS